MLFLSKIGLLIINIYIFSTVVLNTGISVLNLFISIIIFGIFSIILYLYLVKRIEEFIDIRLFGLISGLLFNSFFLLNYIFSSNPKLEAYTFKNTITDIQGSRGRFSSQKGLSTHIILERNAYSDFYFFRTFFDYQKMKNKNAIVYLFEDGFFGMKVIKDYKFTNSATGLNP